MEKLVRLAATAMMAPVLAGNLQDIPMKGPKQSEASAFIAGLSTTD
jgi:hypothetical protein